jgi:hypothetical protein
MIFIKIFWYSSTSQLREIGGRVIERCKAVIENGQNHANPI